MDQNLKVDRMLSISRKLSLRRKSSKSSTTVNVVSITTPTPSSTPSRSNSTSRRSDISSRKSSTKEFSFDTNQENHVAPVKQSGSASSASSTTDSTRGTSVSIPAIEIFDEQSQKWQQQSHKPRKSAVEECLQTAKSRLVARGVILREDPTTSIQLRALLIELRHEKVPRLGSHLDQILKRAGIFVAGCSIFFPKYEAIEPGVSECSSFLLNCCNHFLTWIKSQILLVQLNKIMSALENIGHAFIQICQHESVTSNSTELNKVISEMVIHIVNFCSVVVDSLGDAKIGIFLNQLSIFTTEISIMIWDIIFNDSASALQARDVEDLRSWLAGYQTLTKVRLQLQLKQPYEDVPMEWLSELMSGFLKSQTRSLVMTGASGIGKSGLMASILDRTRLSITTESKLLYFNVEPMSPTRRTSLHLVKSLILQLFEQSVGDMGFLTCLEEIKIAAESSHEPSLWKCFRGQIAARSSSTIIVINGLDKVEGGKKQAVQIHHLLLEIVEVAQKSKYILLCRTILNSKSSQQYLLEPQVWHDDIQSFLESSLRKSNRFSNFPASEMDAVVKNVQQKKITTFPEANIILACFEPCTTLAQLLDILDQLPVGLENLINHQIKTIDLSKPTVRHLLAWLLVAERNMTVQELQTIVQFDEYSTDGEVFRNCCPSLLETHAGYLKFAHPLVRQQFFRLAKDNSTLLQESESHGIVLGRCMLYMQDHLSVIDGIGKPEIEVRSPSSKMLHQISKDTVLEYAVQYWSTHLRLSDLSVEQFSDQITPTWINSIDLVRMENFLWTRSAGSLTVLDICTHTLQVRDTLFNQSNPSVIQNLVHAAYHNLDAGNPSAAMKFIMQAWKGSRSLYDEEAQFCFSAAEWYHQIFSTEMGFVGSNLDDFADVTQLYEYLLKVDETHLGRQHEQTKRRRSILLHLYTSHQDHANIARVIEHRPSRSISDPHENDSESNHANQLIEAYEVLGLNQELCLVVENELDRVIRNHDQQYAIPLKLISYLERYGNSTQAINRLQECHRNLSVQLSNTLIEDDCLVLLQITTRLISIFNTQSRYSEIHGIILSGWRLIEPHLPVGRKVMKEFLHLCWGFIILDDVEAVVPIFEKLEVHYSSEMKHEMMRNNLVLAKWYDGKLEYSRKQQDILLSLLPFDEIHETVIDLCLRLMHLYRSDQQLAPAKDIFDRLTHQFWPQIFDLPLSSLPSYHEKLLELCVVYSDLVTENMPLEDSLSIQRLFWPLFSNLCAPIDHRVFAAAKRLSATFRSIEATGDDISLWSGFRELCQTHLEICRSIYPKVLEELSIAYSGHDNLDTVEVLLELIDSIEPLKRFEMRIDIMVRLVAIFKTVKNNVEIEKWHSKLWCSVKECHHILKDNTVLSIFEEYFTYLMSVQNRSHAIQVIWELRSMLSTNSTVSMVKAGADLIGLLASKNGSVKQAMILHHELCIICSEIHEDQEQVRKIFQDSCTLLNKFGILQSSPKDGAESIFIKTRKQSIDTDMYTWLDQNTIHALIQVTAFNVEREEQIQKAAAIQKNVQMMVIPNLVVIGFFLGAKLYKHLSR